MGTGKLSSRVLKISGVHDRNKVFDEETLWQLEADMIQELSPFESMAITNSWRYGAELGSIFVEYPSVSLAEQSA